MTALPSWLQAGAAVIQAGVDVVAVAGIVGTLLGTIIGAIITWQIQRWQFEHEDETRFHDRRLTVYAEFNDACDKVSSTVLSGGVPAPHMATAVRAYEMLRLVASRPVRDAAGPVQTAAFALIKAPVGNRNPQMAAYNTAMATLVNVMRAELGVEP